MSATRQDAVTALLLGIALTIRAGASEELIEAARQDDAAAVAALLAQRADVNAKTGDGTTALAWAAMRCDADIAARLLAAGANPNLANLYGVAPLSVATANGSVPLVRLLMEKGADPNLAREDGETPLMTAARMGQSEIMKLLIDHGADLNRRDTKFGQTALMWAAGHPAAVRLLVDRNADLRLVTNSWDVKATIYTPGFRTVGVTGIPWNFSGDYTSKKGGQNALFFAVQKRDLESTRILVAAGIDVNLPSADGTTPLLLALYKWEADAGRGSPERLGLQAMRSGAMVFVPDIPMANFLLDRGARADVADAAGYTPLHAAVLAAVAAAKSGEKRGGRKGRSAGEGLAALDSTAAVKMVQRLLEAGADPNRPNLYPTPGPLGSIRINPASPGSSPFHIAAASSDVALTRLLADRGGNPNLLRQDGLTPFAVAVEANNIDVVKEMVARGAGLKMRYNPTAVVSDPAKPIALRRYGETIMHLAAVAHATGVIQYLFSVGVPLDQKNAQGETPLVMADNQEVFEYVLAYEGTGDGGGKWVPRVSTTSDLIKKLLATQ